MKSSDNPLDARLKMLKSNRTKTNPREDMLLSKGQSQAVCRALCETRLPAAVIASEGGNELSLLN